MISEHRKSKALVQSIVQPRAESSIWHNLFVEVEKVRRYGSCLSSTFEPLSPAFLK